VESWRVRTDQASGIVNDPNDWAIEHHDPTYIVDLVGRVVTVSMRTLDTVESLPALELRRCRAGPSVPRSIPAMRTTFRHRTPGQ